jgi:hypothetical protein
MATESLADPRELKPAVSGACVAFMRVLLAREPSDRYESWEALIVRIRAQQRASAEGSSM